MIVQRFTYTVKPGYMEKIVELHISEVAKYPQLKCRIYTPNISENDTFVVEVEFENLAELNKFWEEWFAKPETAEFSKKLHECREPGGDNKIWNLIKA